MVALCEHLPACLHSTQLDEFLMLRERIDAIKAVAASLESAGGAPSMIDS